MLEQCLLLSKCSSVPGLSAQASLAETEEDGAPIRRLICLSQTQIKPAKPNTDCRGLLPQPSTPSQGTEHFQQAAPSQDCRAWGPLEGVSTEEVKEKEIRLFSSFPSKTSRARWAHLWANICSVYGLDQRYFENVAASLLSPWSSPVAHHRSPRAKIKLLCLLGPAGRLLLSEQRAGEVESRGLHRKNETDTTKKLPDTARIRPGLDHCTFALAPPEAGCRPGA